MDIQQVSNLENWLKDMTEEFETKYSEAKKKSGFSYWFKNYKFPDKQGTPFTLEEKYEEFRNVTKCEDKPYIFIHTLIELFYGKPANDKELQKNPWLKEFYKDCKLPCNKDNPNNTDAPNLEHKGTGTYWNAVKNYCIKPSPNNMSDPNQKGYSMWMDLCSALQNKYHVFDINTWNALCAFISMFNSLTTLEDKYTENSNKYRTYGLYACSYVDVCIAYGIVHSYCSPRITKLIGKVKEEIEPLEQGISYIKSVKKILSEMKKVLNNLQSFKSEKINKYDLNVENGVKNIKNRLKDLAKHSEQIGKVFSCVKKKAADVVNDIYKFLKKSGAGQRGQFDDKNVINLINVVDKIQIKLTILLRERKGLFEKRFGSFEYYNSLLKDNFTKTQNAYNYCERLLDMEEDDFIDGIKSQIANYICIKNRNPHWTSIKHACDELGMFTHKDDNKKHIDEEFEKATKRESTPGKAKMSIRKNAIVNAVSLIENNGDEVSFEVDKFHKTNIGLYDFLLQRLFDVKLINWDNDNFTSDEFVRCAVIWGCLHNINSNKDKEKPITEWGVAQKLNNTLYQSSFRTIDENDLFDWFIMSAARFGVENSCSTWDVVTEVFKKIVDMQDSYAMEY